MRDWEAAWEFAAHCSVHCILHSKVHCQALTQLMKKFQSCRSRLDGALQRAEQAVSERASYMGKENLHRCIARVRRPANTTTCLQHCSLFHKTPLGGIHCITSSQA